MEGYWQLTQKECKDSKFNDKQIAEALRYFICDSAYTSRSINDELEDYYSDLMNTSLSNTGINNYAGTVIPLISNQRNESDKWESQLDFSDVAGNFVPPNEPTATTDIFIAPLSNSEQNGDREVDRCSEKLTANQPSYLNLKRFPTLCQPIPSHQDVQSENPKSVATETCVESFRTAKEQLIINDSLKHKSSHGLNNPSYQSKKSLGPRRAGGKFLPPLQDNAVDAVPEDRISKVLSERKAVKVAGDTKEENDELPEELAHLDSKIVQLIMNEIMDTSANLSWSDVAGLEFAKKTIKEIIVLPMLRPDIFNGLRGPPKGLLLFGPPGTGKTLIGKCVASQSKCTFFSISASSLTSKWVGEGEKMVRALFAVARYKQPSVVFLDEIDSLLTQRSEGEHESSRRIKTEFLVQMDGVGCNAEDRILIIGATNRPQELDEAARRRFVKRLYIPLPEDAARSAIVQNLMGQQKVVLSKQDMENIERLTAGYSGADMSNLCKEAALGPVREIKFEDIEKISLDEVRPINYDDFTHALKQVRASVDCSDLDSYLQWNQKFGSWDIANL